MSAKTTGLLMVAVALVVASAPAVAQPLISSPASGTLGFDPGATLNLAWTTVPNSTGYVVEMSEALSFQPLLPLKDPQIAAVAGALGQTYKVEFVDGSALHTGRTYYWRVSALVNGARLTSMTATFSTLSDPFGWLAAHRLFLTRAEDGVDKDKPATVAFIRQGGNNPSQQVVAEFLLGWEGKSSFIPKDGGFALTPSLSFAGNLSSDKTAEDTMAKVAGGTILDWSFGDAPVRSVYQTVDVAYEGDQAFDDANFLVDYLITYSGPGIGRFYPTSAAAPAQIFFRPYLIAAFVKKLDQPEAADDTSARVGPQVDLKVRLNVLARALGMSGSLLSITDRWYSLSGYTRDEANLFSLSLDFQIAKGFTLGYAYKKGHDAPAFKGTNRMAITAGLTFGN
jgi:hypothetical protein